MNNQIQGTDLNNIDIYTKECRLLMAALVKITTESQRDKTPYEVIAQVEDLANKMYNDKPPIETPISRAVGILIDELLKDKSEGSYYYSWQANIAMAFKDEWENWKKIPPHMDNEKFLHEIANQAAKNFLDTLCQKSELQTPINNNE